ncbi:hypothetical protein LCGC14_1328010 [marine sediment metagenome]|uniref:Cryptochrome DASH n=2 Tax=root TaxID=1 RepID=A0A831QRN3_9FLAO|nr:DASH family cryptochrome [Pricia antarctica]
MNDSVLLWFKNDLRLSDNESLQKAIASGKPILPVFCFDKQLYNELDLGFRKADFNRFLFTIQCLQDIRKQLIALGGNLKIVVGIPEIEIAKLVEEYQCSTLFGEQEYAPEELGMLNRLQKSIPKSCRCELTWGKTLYHIDDIPYTIEEIPLTSKAYRINTTKTTEVRKIFGRPEKVNFIKLEDWGEFPEASEFGFKEEILDKKKPYVTGGETNALMRLREYSFETEQLTSYRWTRNRSLGMEYSSKFSAYMALGCISPRTIYWEVKRYEQEIKKNASTWWLIFEIVWRDYFTFKLMRFPNAVFHTEGIKDKTLEFENDTELFKRWCEGKTGIPFVDAHMRQLNQTGYMSNRGRVNCASFLIHDYKIDWTWGASYFEAMLLDYDVSSNWLNWHYQAFESYYTNPVHQSLKYKASEYIKKYLPELSNVDDALIHAPWLLPEAELEALGYPKPQTVFKKWQRSIKAIQKKSQPKLDL